MTHASVVARIARERQQILDLIRERGSVTVQQIAEQLRCTTNKVRERLWELCSEGRAIRHHAPVTVKNHRGDRPADTYTARRQGQ